MVQSFLNNDKLDNDFVRIAMKDLDAVRNRKWNNEQLKYLKLKSVETLILTLEEVRPKSKVREEKRMIIKYLETILRSTQDRILKEDIIALRKKYIIPIFSFKTDNFGFRIAGAWMYALLITIPVDFLLIYYFGQYLFYIPVFSIITIYNGIKKDIGAKKKYRLW